MMITITALPKEKKKEKNRTPLTLAQRLQWEIFPLHTMVKTTVPSPRGSTAIAKHYISLVLPPAGLLPLPNVVG